MFYMGEDRGFKCSNIQNCFYMGEDWGFKCSKIQKCLKIEASSVLKYKNVFYMGEDWGPHEMFLNSKSEVLKACYTLIQYNNVALILFRTMARTLASFIRYQFFFFTYTVVNLNEVHNKYWQCSCKDLARVHIQFISCRT